MLTPDLLVLSLVAGLLFALFTARPNKRVGPFDEMLESRERWAFTTFSFFISTTLYAVTFALVGPLSFLGLILVSLPLTIVLVLLQAGYYFFLVKDSPAGRKWLEERRRRNDE